MVREAFGQHLEIKLKLQSFEIVRVLQNFA